MADLSEDAKNLCAAWFPHGEKCTVRSHAPHEIMKRRQAAVDELVKAGLIKREPYNRLGSILLTGTDKAGEIGRAHGLLRIGREDRK